MGCDGQPSEFDCVSHLKKSVGQAGANAAFQEHWRTWITEADFNEMQAYGLNTVRIPVGYWMMESIIFEDSENFPRGGVEYLKQVCEWASSRGFYIIIE